MQWVVNTIYSMLRWRAFPPRYIFRLALEMARQSAAVLQSASTPDGYAVWSELQNKIEAFSLFEYADSELGVAGHPGVPLHELVSRAFQLGPYRSVWAMEGLGYCYAGLHSHGGLFCEDKTSRLPAASLVPLHTGMGLAFAQRVLESMSGNQSRDFTLLDKFAQLCRDNSQNGYAGAAFEALGLVTRNLYPHLVPVVDAYLSQSEVFLAYFWHGIGRINIGPGLAERSDPQKVFHHEFPQLFAHPLCGVLPQAGRTSCLVIEHFLDVAHDRHDSSFDRGLAKKSEASCRAIERPCKRKLLDLGRLEPPGG
jgi:hypothetical protein